MEPNSTQERHVPTIQELIRDRLIKNATPSTASEDTVLAQASAKLLANSIIFGARPGTLTLTRRTLTFQGKDASLLVTVPVDGITKTTLGTFSLIIEADKKYGFRLEKSNQPNAAASSWLMTLRQLRPNMIVKQSRTFRWVIKISLYALAIIIPLLITYLFVGS